MLAPRSAGSVEAAFPRQPSCILRQGHRAARMRNRIPHHEFATLPRLTAPVSLRTPLALLATSLGMIALVWWWLAMPVMLARAPIDPAAKLDCVSYAPFRGVQNPLTPGLVIDREHI